LSSRTESLLLPLPLQWIEDPDDEFHASFTDAFQFFATRPFLPSLPEWRRDFGTGRRREFEH
jgi:hypothetical protein